MSKTTAARGKAILVLGMHRSGTSAVTRVLNLLGADLGGNFLRPGNDNRLGFWEHADAVLLNEKLMHALDRSWDDTRPLPDNWLESTAASEARKQIAALIERDFSGSRLWAVKDPRLCRLAPLWIEVAESLDIDVCVLLVVRHPTEVADSLHSRDGMDLYDARLAWLEHFLESELASRGLPRAFVLYDDLLSDWEQVFSDAGAHLGLDWPKSLDYASSAISAFLTPKERHHNVDDRDAPAVFDVATELYEECVAVSRNKGDLSKLIKLVEECVRISPLFLKKILSLSTQVADAAARAQQAEDRLNGYQNEVNVAHEAIKDNERRIHGLLETVHGKDLHIQNRDALIQSKDDEIQNRGALLSDKALEIQRLNELVRAADVEIKRQGELLQVKDVEIQRLNGLVCTAEVENKRQAAVVQVSEAEIKRLAELVRAADSELKRQAEQSSNKDAEIQRLKELVRAADVEVKQKVEQARDKDAEIQRLSELVRAANVEVKHQAEMTRGKDLEIQRLNELVRAEDVVVKHQAELAQLKDIELQRLNDLVRAADVEVVRHSGQVQVKDAEIQRLNGLVRAAETEVKHQAELMHAKDIEIQQLRELIEIAKAEMQRQKETTRAMDEQIRKQASTLAANEDQLRSLSETLGECGSKLRNAEASLRSNLQRIAEMEDAARDAEKRLAARTDALERSEQVLREQAAQIGELQGEVRRLANSASASDARIVELENSRSWALTRPLRKIKTFVTARRPRRSAPIEDVKVSMDEPQTVLLHEPDTTSEPTATADVASPITMPTFDLRAGSPGAVILTTRHCHHLALEIQSALTRIGSSSEIIFEAPAGGYRDVPHFVICPQIFQTLPGLYVSFQMEQSVSSRWFTDDYIRTLENSFAIFDYSLNNIAHLQELGLHAKQMFHVPVGYLDNYPERESDGSYDCDVLFYGDIHNARRRNFIDALSRVCKVKIHSDLFGEALHAEMARARLIVNIHYYEDALLETTRLWECVSLGHLVVSERAIDMDQHQELQELVDFVEVDDVSAMVERVSYWLADDARRHQRLKQNRQLLHELPNGFDYHFYRFLLATDNITFDQFWDLAGAKVKLPGDRLCLNLPEYVARSQSFDRDNQFGFVRFAGLRHNNGWIGCAMSYKFMMRLARQEGRSMLTICEDDVEFPPDFELRWHKIQKHLAASPSSWDAFSGLMANLHAEARIARTHEDDGVRYVETDRLISMVFNVYGTKVFDIADTWDESDRDENSNTIDRYLERQSSLRVLTTTPFLVGHKEDLHSTLWGFQNTAYSNLIAESSALLEQKMNSHLGE